MGFLEAASSSLQLRIYSVFLSSLHVLILINIANNLTELQQLCNLLVCSLSGAPKTTQARASFQTSVDRNNTEHVGCSIM